MAPRKRKGLVQVKLRIPEQLKRALDREAIKRDDGSISAEIADRLEKSFTSPDLARATAKAVVEELAERGFVDLEKLVHDQRREDYESDPDNFRDDK